MTNKLGLNVFEMGDLRNDKCYKLLHMQDNEQISNYKITNYRNDNCSNPIHNGPFDKDLSIYNGLNVNNGYTGGCNIMTDDELTRGLQVSRPEDKLMGRIEEQERYMIPLPNSYNPAGFCTDTITNNMCPIITKAEISGRPQMGFDPMFNRIGINARNYQRKDAAFYKEKTNYNFMNDVGERGRYTKKLYISDKK